MQHTVSDSDVLSAKEANPHHGPRRLVRVLWPDEQDERTIRKLSAKVRRVLEKHGRSTRAEKPSRQPKLASLPKTPPKRLTTLEQCEADIAELRDALALMRADSSWQAYTRALSLVRTLEQEREAIIAATSSIDTKDISTDRIVGALRRLPRRLLEQALAA